MAFLTSPKCIKNQCQDQCQALFFSNDFKEFKTEDQVMNFKNSNEELLK